MEKGEKKKKERERKKRKQKKKKGKIRPRDPLYISVTLHLKVHTPSSITFSLL
jgi:hypothetical protein